MAEELKDLIEKIREEGVLAAEEKARQIEAAARQEAQVIVEKARRDAEKALAEAKERISRMEDGQKASLKQAGRDLILSLKKEIGAMLDKIVLSHVHKALSTEELARMIPALIKEHPKLGKEEIVISLKKEDLEKLEKGFLSELREEIKKGVILKASEEIQAGFMISYDSGKSYYDFTDKALGRYISSFLKPKLGEILNGA